MKKLLSTTLLFIALYLTISYTAILTEWAVSHFAKTADVPATDKEVIQIAVMTAVFWALFYFAKENDN